MGWISSNTMHRKTTKQQKGGKIFKRKFKNWSPELIAASVCIAPRMAFPFGEGISLPSPLTTCIIQMTLQSIIMLLNICHLLSCSEVLYIFILLGVNRIKWFYWKCELKWIKNMKLKTDKWIVVIFQAKITPVVKVFSYP